MRNWSEPLDFGADPSYLPDMNNKQTNLTTSADGIFLHSSNPSPVMLAAMDSIRRQMAAETAYRERVRAGLEPAGEWGILNISDRD